LDKKQSIVALSTTEAEYMAATQPIMKLIDMYAICRCKHTLFHSHTITECIYGFTLHTFNQIHCWLMKAHQETLTTVHELMTHMHEIIRIRFFV